MSSAQDFKVLIVEDYVEVSEVLETDLRAMNFASHIIKAYSLKEAMQMIEENQGINFILIDWKLPDGDGLKLLKGLRNNALFKDCPIMMVTGKDSIDDILEATRLGASEYLVKPFTTLELKEKVEHLIEKHLQYQLLA